MKTARQWAAKSRGFDWYPGGLFRVLASPRRTVEKEVNERENDHSSHKKRRPEGRRFVLREALCRAEQFVRIDHKLLRHARVELAITTWRVIQADPVSYTHLTLPTKA